MFMRLLWLLLLRFYLLLSLVFIFPFCCRSCTRIRLQLSVFVCIFYYSFSLSLSSSHVQTHITRARRNFHFYWRHIKCTYYIMVHSIFYLNLCCFIVLLYVSIIVIIVFASCDYLGIQFYRTVSVIELIIK